jgi:hypothetical protein
VRLEKMAPRSLIAGQGDRRNDCWRVGASGRAREKMQDGALRLFLSGCGEGNEDEIETACGNVMFLELSCLLWPLAWTASPGGP